MYQIIYFWILDDNDDNDTCNTNNRNINLIKTLLQSSLCKNHAESDLLT